MNPFLFIKYLKIKIHRYKMIIKCWLVIDARFYFLEICKTILINKFKDKKMIQKFLLKLRLINLCFIRTFLKTNIE